MERHGYPDRHSPRDHRPGTPKNPRPNRGTSGRIFWIIVAATAACFLIIPMRGERHVIVPQTPKPIGSLSVRDAHSQAAWSGILGGAKAGQEVLVRNEQNRQLHNDPEATTIQISTPVGRGLASDPFVVVSPATPNQPQAAIRMDRIRSLGAFVKKEDALSDAIRVARVKLAEVLIGLDPPIEQVPSEQQIRDAYVNANAIREIAPDVETQERWRANGLETSRIWVEIDIEVSEDQLRSLRGKHRVFDAIWIAGALLAVLLTTLGFLRLDTWTKGYLTTTLSIVAIVLIGGVVAALFVFR